MIHSPCKGLDDALHLQREEEGGEARDVDIRLHGDEIDLQVVGLGEGIHDELLLWGQLGEEAALYALLLGSHQRGIILPSHVLDKVGGTGDEACSVASDEVVATLAVGIAHSAWEGEDIPAVGLGDVAGDEASAVGGTLYQDAGIRYASHDAVAAHEVNLVGIRLGEKFGQ